MNMEDIVKLKRCEQVEGIAKNEDAVMMKDVEGCVKIEYQWDNL